MELCAVKGIEKTITQVDLKHLLFDLLVQDTSSWPLIEPLPSYGRGRELPGGRYTSLIHGNGLQDVVITGSCFVTTQILMLNYYDYCRGMKLLLKNAMKLLL